jgi:hypothetical protein
MSCHLEKCAKQAAGEILKRYDLMMQKEIGINSLRETLGDLIDDMGVAYPDEIVDSNA